jgi:hypothetical protein
MVGSELQVHPDDITVMESHERAVPKASDLPMLPAVGGPKGSRRRSGRLPQESLQCNLGTVLDISAGGMRVLTRAKPSGRLNVVLQGYPLPEPLAAEVAWTKRSGLFMREVGLCFHDVSPQMAQFLTRIAMMHRFRRVI